MYLRYQAGRANPERPALKGRLRSSRPTGGCGDRQSPDHPDVFQGVVANELALWFRDRQVVWSCCIARGWSSRELQIEAGQIAQLTKTSIIWRFPRAPR